MKNPKKAVPNYILRCERELRGWSQRYIAEQIDAPSSSYIHRWEQGLSSPSPFYREKLCNIFGKNAYEMGFLSGDEKQEWKELASRSRSLSQPEIEMTCWYVPYRRNPFFTGREQVLVLLNELRYARKGTILTHIQALSGLGGVGKTQTALEYAYRFRERYQAVFWIRAENQEMLLSDCKAINALLQPQQCGEHNQDKIIAYLRRWLNSHDNWLLILDNVGDLALIQEILPDDQVGHTLLTIRAQYTAGTAHRIDLDGLNPEDGALFLLRRAGLLGVVPAYIGQEQPVDPKTSKYEAALELSGLVDGLPLALDQAAAYIEETGCRVDEYLDYFKKHQSVLLDRRGGLNICHPQSVSATLAFAIERLEHINPTALDLLRLCAFLHPDAIPEELITEGARELPPNLRAIVTDPLLLGEAIQALRGSSLLRRDDEMKTFSIHRLVKAVLKHKMSTNEQRQWSEQIVRLVNRVFPAWDNPVNDTDDTWIQAQRLLSHARECAFLVEQEQIVSEEASHLFYQVAIYYWKRGQYMQAETLLKQTLHVHFQLYREKYYQRAHALYEQRFGRNHPTIATTLHDYANLLTAMQHTNEAQRLRERAQKTEEHRMQQD